MEPLGLYLHIPFCRSKCAYCDFYSFAASDLQIESYKNKLVEDILKSGNRLGRRCDTVYFGGGTPALLGGRRIAEILEVAEKSFGFSNPEITLEANPADDLFETLSTVHSAGVNRLSLGVQSGNENELKILDRRHTLSDVERTVNDAKRAGIENISLDLMLGIPDQTETSLADSIKFLCSFDPAHISAYILKIEPETPFGKSTPDGLPDDDAAAGLYLSAVEQLAQAGYSQYEISNFAKDGRVSRHNIKYWTGLDYLGLGPAAHSKIGGKRFFFPRDLGRYMNGESPVYDGAADNEEEYIMLRLRLSSGMDFLQYRSLFNKDIDEPRLKKMRAFEKSGAAVLTDNGFHLTPNGFLISNYIISELL